MPFFGEMCLDYAVIILRTAITFVPGKVEPVCLFLGDVRWVSSITCQRKETSLGCLPSQICFNEAKGGVCYGDSGGPVIGHEQNLGAWVQIGINSFIDNKTGELECGTENTISFSATFFYFEEPGLDSKTGNPWCDFFTKEIPNDVHLNALDKPQQRRRPLVFQNQVLRRRLAGKHAQMLSRKYPLLHRYRVANTLSRYGSVPPMDPDTVVTFEPTYSCPKMVSKPLHPLQKIYFGSDVEEQEFPFLVAIEIILEITGYCTGSIATRNHVLTAAHCVKWYDNHPYYVEL
ncbi:unnamed protein product [Cyprideis torosa]|uniref:Peptidase S1 domain-containing protein n=1 Tax=Cyprideis torosa TaxID=163714 RepID=A0A7R8WLJ5_9CRUS|nr:unnamed protein product [Cyprideis torosa]CAG0898247.1 unnamed protein product [Cyprideis torosa]